MPAFFQRFVSDFFQHRYGQLEHRRAVHVQIRFAGGAPPKVPGTHRMSDWLPSACRRWPGCLGFARRQHHGAGAVAEQHAGGAVVEIENAREHFGADHQHVLVHAGADEASAVDSAYTKPLHTAARRRRRRCW
jgi:hypothetical protein